MPAAIVRTALTSDVMPLYTGPMSATWAYKNGDWIPSGELRVAVDDVGFLLGATVTERLRTFRGQVFRLEEHLARMRHSLEVVGLDAARISAELGDAICQFIERNRGQIADDDDWSVIAFVTPGLTGAGRPSSDTTSRAPIICVHGYPLPFDQWASRYEAGVSVVVSDVRQVPSNCWPPELKCRSRMHFYLADRRAAEAQPGARAVLLDQDGFVAEATTANVLIYRADEGLVTPPADHVLFGVSIGVVAELAKELHVPFNSRRLTADELRSADEAMLTSTSICVQPIVACDGVTIGGGRPGPMYGKLLAAWSELVGLDIAAQARRFLNRTI
jgi:branched-subunit amino acid aminotransferase/4-amino-4-deoxychorismate lyase